MHPKEKPTSANPGIIQPVSRARRPQEPPDNPPPDVKTPIISRGHAKDLPGLAVHCPENSGMLEVVMFPEHPFCLIILVFLGVIEIFCNDAGFHPPVGFT